MSKVEKLLKAKFADQEKFFIDIDLDFSANPGE